MTRGFEHDYKCNECDTDFIVRYGFDGPESAITCPECLSENTRKVYSTASALIFNWWKVSASRDGAGLTYRRHYPTVKSKFRSK